MQNFSVWKIQFWGQNTNTNKLVLIFFCKWKKTITFGMIFFSKYKLNLFGYHSFTPIQIQIYLGVPILGQCEYIYDYSDKYSKIKILIWIHSTQNKIYVYEYKCYKSMQINRHMCHNIWFIVLD